MMKHLKTYEQYSITPEELNEGFFGNQKYVLDDKFKSSKEALDFVTNPARAKSMKVYSDALSKHGMDAETIKKAVAAIYDFGKGVPLLNKYTLTYDLPSKTLEVNPNGKGLFNGSPIMG